VSEREQRAAELLSAIESELRCLDLWSERPPADAALRSQLPFCFDTMSFDRWLQWVLIPRLRETLRDRRRLPGSSGIAAMAELHFGHVGADVVSLIRLLRDLDRTLEGV